LRLIKSFNDYYDGALSLYFNEPNPIYIRTDNDQRYYGNEIFEMLPKYKHEYRKDFDCALQNISVLIVIAGKGYPGNLCVVGHTPATRYQNSEEILRYMFGYDNIKLYPSPRSFFKTQKDQFDAIEAFDFSELHRLVGLPMFACTYEYDRVKKCHYINIIKAPKLKETYSFQDTLDPHTVAQEIHMYLCNQMVSDTKVKVPVGSDEVIAASKGFDEWSFRTPPKKK